MNRDTLIRVALITVCCALSTAVQAQLKPLSDKALSNVTGQAMVAIDYTQGPNSDFTRVTMGMNTEVQTNITSMALGTTTNTSGVTASDVNIDHFSLGHISTDSTKVQLDGNTYASGSIVPFQGIDPYVEFAYTSGVVSGVRLGFNQARGTVEGNLNSFSGNIGLKVTNSSGTVENAQLMDANSNPTNYRAQYIGISGADCATGVNCAVLNSLKTLDVGKANADGTVGYTNGFFISVQKQTVNWQAPDGTVISAGPGVYFNIPTSMTLSLSQLQNGIARDRTEYIDRGLGLF